MKQVYAFAEKINLRNTKKEYYRTAALASVNDKEIKSLEEVLGVESSNEGSAFDPKTDEYLEKLALQRLEERKAIFRV